MGTTPFTVLMPVYRMDDAGFARAAFDSATTSQQLKPERAVIVVDGPVGQSIGQWLDEVGQRDDVTVVQLPENGGLAHALNVGLQHVATPIVARVDADDICLPQRFAVQVPMIESGYDVVGSAIAEFDDDPNEPQAVRPVDTDPDEIRRNARMSSPLHHPSVVFRVDSVVQAGGYPELNRMEDYLLWARMIMRGARIGNAPEPLVLYRVGSGAYSRRGGAAMARSEAQLQRAFYAMGFVTRRQYVRNKLMRGAIYRLMPTGLRRVTYRVWTWVRTPAGVRQA